MYQIRPRWMISPMFRRDAFFFVVVFVTMMVASSGAEEGSEDGADFPPFSADCRGFPAPLSRAGRVVGSINIGTRAWSRLPGRWGVIGSRPGWQPPADPS